MYSNDLKRYLKSGPFSSDIGIANLHPSKRTHWVLYINESFVDSIACAPPQKLSKFIIKRNRHCLYSEYKKQGLTSKKDCFFASYCLYIRYLAKVSAIGLKSTVLYLYYQTIS